MAKIGVDLDGVIYDFTHEATVVCAKHLGVDPDTLERAATWNFYQSWGLSGKEFWDIIHDGVVNGLVWCNGVPTPGSVEALTALRKEGHSIHICTSRAPYEEETVKWLKSAKVPFDSVTVAKDKSILSGVDFFLDDYEGNYRAMKECGVRHVAIWDQPWNRHVQEADRIYSWSDFLGYVTENS